MLALTRKEGETIFVGDYEIVVLEIGVEVVQLRISLKRDAEDLFVEFWAGMGEDFRIGKNVLGRITVVRHHDVGIAIEAPREITIMRSEIVGKPTRNENGRGHDRFPGIH